jgi:hypothetical protein
MTADNLEDEVKLQVAIGQNCYRDFPDAAQIGKYSRLCELQDVCRPPPGNAPADQSRRQYLPGLPSQGGKRKGWGKGGHARALCLAESLCGNSASPKVDLATAAREFIRRVEVLSTATLFDATLARLDGQETALWYKPALLFLVT